MLPAFGCCILLLLFFPAINWRNYITYTYGGHPLNLHWWCIFLCQLAHILIYTKTLKRRALQLALRGGGIPIYILSINFIYNCTLLYCSCHSYSLSFWLGMVVPLIVICGATWTTYCLTMPNFIRSWNKDGYTDWKRKRTQLWSKVFFTAIALSLLLSVVWITGCLVLLNLPTSSQKAVDGIFTLFAIAYGLTMLTSHCLRPQMQSCTLCCQSPDESPSQNSCTISNTSTLKSTLARHLSEMEDVSTTPKPTEIGMQDITLIKHQAAASNDALDSQSLHIAFGAEDEAGRELHSGDDFSSEDNAASPFNLKVPGECLVMENRMADDAL